MNNDLLTCPFKESDIEWRIQQSGISRNGKPYAMVLAYVTNRAIQDRLDDVFGHTGWQNEFKPGPLGGIICGISVWADEISQWVTKWDGAENTNVEAVKGGLSSSMKRAAVQWGIGRYLYRLDTNFAETSTEKPSDMTGWHRASDKKTGQVFYWKTPSLPEEFLPTTTADDHVIKSYIDRMKSCENMDDLHRAFVSIIEECKCEYPRDQNVVDCVVEIKDQIKNNIG